MGNVVSGDAGDGSPSAATAVQGADQSAEAGQGQAEVGSRDTGGSGDNADGERETDGNDDADGDDDDDDDADDERIRDDDEELDEDTLRGIHRLDSAVRKKVRGGVRFNMRILIRGARKSGKSSLWRRLQGLPFSAEYRASPELQTATINWSFKSFQDVVKVEVWDVVDKGFKKGARANAAGGAGAASGDATYDAALAAAISQARAGGAGGAGMGRIGVADAQSVDVYRGAHAVIFMIDPFAKNTFAYVKRKIADVPLHMCVLILMNFRDVVHSTEELGKQIRSQALQARSAQLQKRHPRNTTESMEGKGVGGADADDDGDRDAADHQDAAADDDDAAALQMPSVSVKEVEKLAREVTWMRYCQRRGRDPADATSTIAGQDGEQGIDSAEPDSSGERLAIDTAAAAAAIAGQSPTAGEAISDLPSPRAVQNAAAEAAGEAIADVAAATGRPQRDLTEEAMAGLEIHPCDKVHVFHTSMMNCFGLKLLYEYLGIPFLQVKQASLRDQLKAAERDAQNALGEAERAIQKNNYKRFLKQVKRAANRRKQNHAGSGVGEATISNAAPRGIAGPAAGAARPGSGQRAPTTTLHDVQRAIHGGVSPPRRNSRQHHGSGGNNRGRTSSGDSFHSGDRDGSSFASRGSPSVGGLQMEHHRVPMTHSSSRGSSHDMDAVASYYDDDDADDHDGGFGDDGGDEFGANDIARAAAARVRGDRHGSSSGGGKNTQVHPTATDTGTDLELNDADDFAVGAGTLDDFLSASDDDVPAAAARGPAVARDSDSDSEDGGGGPMRGGGSSLRRVGGGLRRVGSSAQHKASPSDAGNGTNTAMRRALVARDVDNDNDADDDGDAFSSIPRPQVLDSEDDDDGPIDTAWKDPTAAGLRQGSTPSPSQGALSAESLQAVAAALSEAQRTSTLEPTSSPVADGSSFAASAALGKKKGKRGKGNKKKKKGKKGGASTAQASPPVADSMEL